jgi:hypothetical protein
MILNAPLAGCRSRLTEAAQRGVASLVAPAP